MPARMNDYQHQQQQQQQKQEKDKMHPHESTSRTASGFLSLEEKWGSGDTHNTSPTCIFDFPSLPDPSTPSLKRPNSGNGTTSRNSTRRLSSCQQEELTSQLPQHAPIFGENAVAATTATATQQCVDQALATISKFDKDDDDSLSSVEYSITLNNATTVLAGASTHIDDEEDEQQHIGYGYEIAFPTSDTNDDNKSNNNMYGYEEAAPDTRRRRRSSSSRRNSRYSASSSHPSNNYYDYNDHNRHDDYLEPVDHHHHQQEQPAVDYGYGEAAPDVIDYGYEEAAPDIAYKNSHPTRRRRSGIHNRWQAEQTHTTTSCDLMIAGLCESVVSDTTLYSAHSSPSPLTSPFTSPINNNKKKSGSKKSSTSSRTLRRSSSNPDAMMAATTTTSYTLVNGISSPIKSPNKKSSSRTLRRTSSNPDAVVTAAAVVVASGNTEGRRRRRKERRGTGGATSIGTAAKAAAIAAMSSSTTPATPRRSSMTGGGQGGDGYFSPQPRRRSSMKQPGQTGRRASIQLGAEKSVILPITGERVRRRSSITFDEIVIMQPVAPVSELTKNPQELWFQPEDVTERREKSHRLVQAVESGHAANMGMKPCLRGLESYIPDQLIEKSTLRYDGWDSVLDEQQLQIHNCSYDEEAISKVYRRASMKGQELATQRAKQDEKDVEKYLKSTRRMCRRLSC